MNDTTRDERLEKDRIRRNDDPEYRAWRYNNDLDHVEAIYEFVDRKVAEAVAARDAEIREKLLSDGAVEKGAESHDAWLFDDVWTVIACRNASRRVIESALDHIGLGDGTGGQG